jgi:hypothetical protein
LPLDDAIARETVRLRQLLGLKVPNAIILATARCAGGPAGPHLAPSSGPISTAKYKVCEKNQGACGANNQRVKI